MKPITEKITKPAKILVALFVHVTIIVSLLRGKIRIYKTKCYYMKHFPEHRSNKTITKVIHVSQDNYTVYTKQVEQT